MHAFHVAVAFTVFILMIGACSSELQHAQPLAIGSTGSDAAFSFYDRDEGEGRDSVVTAEEILLGEKTFGATAVSSPDIARQLVSDYDFDGNGVLDNLEFTGLVNAGLLSGVRYNPQWLNAELAPSTPAAAGSK